MDTGSFGGERVERSSGKIEFSRLAPDDWEKVRDLRLRALRDEPKAFGESPEEADLITEGEWRDRLEKGTYLFAMKNGEIVGMVSTRRDRLAKTKHVVHIQGMYITPEARGQGIAYELLKKAMEESQKEAFTIKFALAVGTYNKLAQELYKKLGFREIWIEEKEMIVNDEYIDEILMEKVL